MSDHEQPTSEPATTVVAEEEEDEIEKGLFEEPEDFYKPPPEPTFRTYHRKCGEDGAPSSPTPLPHLMCEI